MKSPSENIYKMQMAYFFREKSEIRTFGLISSLYEQLRDWFKTEPQSLPVQGDVPPNVICCVWNDVNTSLMFSKERLDFTFNIPTKENWEDLFHTFHDKVVASLNRCSILVDRVGLVAEVAYSDSLHNLLKDYINIEKFNDASEAKISWLERVGLYNFWINFVIAESMSENNIVFDVNSLPECRLSDPGMAGVEAMRECAEILKGRMANVL